jgi:hypothetical protein
MIESFFQSLNSSDTEYLLISGQATVLYGAATFSEDIDLWVNPTAANADRFRTALRSCNARYYKLTPPWDVEWLSGGHGFHFLLPGTAGNDVYLDVMGAPPRIPPFAEAASHAQWLETDWGKVRVVGIRELIELKKTQRLEDYPIIGRLAVAWLDQLNRTPSSEDYRWALGQVFTLPELQTLLEKHPAAAAAVPETAPAPLRKYVSLFPGVRSEQVEAEIAAHLQSRIVELQNADRQYWRRIVQELRELRQKGRLMREGAPV